MNTVPQSHLFRIIHLLALCIFGLVIFSLSGCGNAVERTNFDLTAENTPVCSSNQLDEWNFIQDHQMGVAGRDPIGDRIEDFTAVDNYAPYATRKKTLCGTLMRYHFADLWGAEADWNNQISPSEPFRHLLTDPLTFGWAEPNDYWGCASDSSASDCVEAEITPDDYFENNPWFPNDGSDQSFLVGNELCTYGPYVGDANHGNKPEIHPSELYWIRFPPDEFSRQVTTLMLIQDDSNRFDRPSDFDVENSPAGWRPWSAVPRTGEFNLAFDITTGPLGIGQIQNLDISEAFVPRNVVTKEHADAHQDADDGKDHAVTYNGQIVLRVRELQPNDDDIGVQFKNVCRIDDSVTAKTRLKGYVTLTSVVGVDDRGEEGYQILDVNEYKGEFQSLPATLEPAKVSAISKILPETIYPAQFQDKTEIRADLQVTLIGQPDVKESDLKITKVERLQGNQRQQLTFTSVQNKPGSNEFQVVVKEMPVSNGGHFELIVESGKVFKLSAPPISLAPAIIMESVLFSSNDPTNWKSFVAASGGNLQELISPPQQLQRVSQWELDITPLYAPLKDGKTYSEDDSPVTEELNDIISHSDSQRLDKIFGSDKPFSVEWLYEAKNLTTGEEVSVNTTGNALPTDVKVEILEDKSIIEKLKITFPNEPKNVLFELNITTRMTDSFGNTSEVRHTLWSHMLLDQDKNKLAQTVIPIAAVLAGIPADDLLADGQRGVQEYSLIPPDSKHRIEEMLRLIAIRAAYDQRISVSELASLIQGARLFGSQ